MIRLVLFEWNNLLKLELSKNNELKPTQQNTPEKNQQKFEVALSSKSQKAKFLLIYWLKLESLTILKDALKWLQNDIKTVLYFFDGQSSCSILLRFKTSQILENFYNKFNRTRFNDFFIYLIKV